MNRLKHEWQQLQMPASTREEVRAAAWNRLHGSPAWGRRSLGVAAAILLAMALLLLRPSSGPPLATQESLASLPLMTPDEPVFDWALEAKGPPPRRLPPRPVERAVATAAEPAIAESRRRSPGKLVLNLSLPESGVRVVWIKNDNFDLPIGGSE